MEKNVDDAALIANLKSVAAREAKIGNGEMAGILERLAIVFGERVSEIAALRGALNECADDLEAEVEARYSHGIKEHPAMTPKYERDMESVVKARVLLTKAS
jgi:hypothetical protein